MSVREYVGARYVPIFGRKDETSIDWDDTKPYEPLTIVLYQGNSYTSRQYVPAGVPITNETYWALTGNYNAQVEAYRAEVQTFRNDIDANTAGIAAINNEIGNGFSSENTIEDAFNGVSDDFDIITGIIGTGFSSENTISDNITELQNRTVTPYSANLRGKNLVVFGDSFSAIGGANSLDAYWCRRVSAALGTTFNGFAVGAAGFARTGNTIAMQLQTALTAMDETERENTGIVITYAGYNDVYNALTRSAIVSAMQQHITDVYANFPNALHVFVPFNWGYGQFTYNHIDDITSIMNSFAGYTAPNVCVVSYAWLWNAGIAGRFQNASHPNSAGYDVIASHILNAINGSQANGFGVTGSYDWAAATYVNSGHIYIQSINGIVHVNGYLKAASIPAGGTNFPIWDGNAPAVIVPTNESIIIPLMAANRGKAFGHLRIDNTAVVRAFFEAGADETENYFFTASFPLQVGTPWSS